MELKVKKLIETIDLTKSEAMLPIYECIVNSIISLNKVEQSQKYIKVFIERQDLDEEPDLFGKNPKSIKNVLIVDNGEGFTNNNYLSFCMPYSNINKQYGCKGVGRFTILAMFRKINVDSIFSENGKWWQRKFSFDSENEINNHSIIELEGNHTPQTKVKLIDCNNADLINYTAKNTDEIAKGIMEHCFIYYLCNTLPSIDIVEEASKEGNAKSLAIKNYFDLEAKDKEKDVMIYDKNFHLYILKNDKITSRKYNYVTLCANSRAVGVKRNLADYDSLYVYPIVENNRQCFLDVYVVSDYLDQKINNARTAFKIPEKNESCLEFEEETHLVSIEDIMRAICKEVEGLYASHVRITKEKTIEETKKYIIDKAPQYNSFLFRNDVLEAMPPNMSEEKKEEYLHGIAFKENKDINDKIAAFIKTRVVTESSINNIVSTIKARTAYSTDVLADYVFRRKAIIQLFEKMLDAKKDGTYELEKMIHNIIFPMGLTNRQLNYQYHNLWLLDDRLSSFKFIASDKTITSFSQIQSSKEPDLICINQEQNLVDNRIAFGDKDAGTIDMMVIFEFKRPGDTAHQKQKNDNRWEFSELVEKYFDTFLYNDKEKKNYRGNIVKVTPGTPKFGYIIMDEMPDALINYNQGKGWGKTPYNSYYKILPNLNTHYEAITYQDLLENAKARNNPFFDHLFTSKL